MALTPSLRYLLSKQPNSTISAAQVVLKSLLEQLILCITGIGIGLVCMLLREGGELPYSVCVVILLSYCLGAVIAVALTVRVDVMTVLRDKE